MAFAKRYQSDGSESAIDPTADLDVEIPDGVVAAKDFVGRLEPESQHGQEVLDEDDAWLGLAAAELWEYDVVDGREQDFIDAIQNSEVVMEYSLLDETSVDPEDVTAVPLSDSSTKIVRGGPDARATDDGPAGQPTGTAAQTAGNDSSGGIDDLSVVGGSDPKLGLTARNADNPPQDPAADTGPTRTAESAFRKTQGR